MDFTQIILPIITGVITFLLGRRRGKAETESVILQNLEKSIGIYQILVENLRDEIIILNAKVDELQQKLDDMEKSRRTPTKKVLK
jgi:peptidoglycan hydrolase CwlO-like protein